MKSTIFHKIAVYGASTQASNQARTQQTNIADGPSISIYPARYNATKDNKTNWVYSSRTSINRRC